MATPPNKSKDKKHKHRKIIDQLKFTLTLDDEEIMKATIESIIESLEEEINK